MSQTPGDSAQRDAIDAALGQGAEAESTEPVASASPDGSVGPPAVQEPIPAPPQPSSSDEPQPEAVEVEGDDDKQVESKKKPTKRRQPRKRNDDAFEQRLQGRRSLCPKIADIAPHMLKTVKLRVYGQHLDSRKGLDEKVLTERIVRDAKKIAAKDQVLQAVHELDPDVDRRNLRWIILFEILLQEETHSLEERRLEEKVLEYEKSLIQRADELDFFDAKKHDAIRWHYYDTYKLVLEAAWRHENDISLDEAQLLRVLRGRLNISMEEHYLISCHINRFPKQGRKLHTRDEIHEARKKLQRQSLLWSYRDENNRNIDVIPAEVVQVLRAEVVELELQNTNYTRVLQHDAIKTTDLRQILGDKGMDKYGNKEGLIERIVNSDLRPTEVLDVLARPKLADMCRLVGLGSTGTKADLIHRLIDFYDDLSFEERTTKDDREVLYNNYELLAARRYADLKAKKVISRDLDVEHLFEHATQFLFEKKFKATIELTKSGKRADGRIVLDNKESFLWDCKSVENAFNLQDHLESQFDLYLRRERENGYDPLAFLVIAPEFTVHSLKLAHQYKARTNWDVALVTASALKYLADQWSAAEPNKAFPVRLFNRTELIDEQKADLLLSLA